VSTPYKVLYDNVLSKIRDYDLNDLEENEIYEILSDYLLPAIVSFRVCKKDLSDRDSVGFNATLNDTEIEILSNYMALEYIRGNYIRVPNMMKMQLSSKDFNAFSPANQLDKIQSSADKLLFDTETLVTRYTWLKKDD
jgi:hypothetical protein